MSGKRLRLHKKDILKGRQTFDEVFSEGGRFHSKHFVILTKPCERVQLGFAVSKRIKGAVKRNRAKRRLREIVRTNKRCLPVGRIILFVAKPGIERANFELLQREYRDLLKKLD